MAEIGACGLFAALGTGVGGNLPVDGALFLEFLPTASGRHLTLLSVWWPLGQLVASLIGWAFLGSHYAINKGWGCKSLSYTSILKYSCVDKILSTQWGL